MFACDRGWYARLLQDVLEADTACVLITGDSSSGRTTLLRELLRDSADQHNAIIKRWSTDLPWGVLQPTHSSIAAYMTGSRTTVVAVDDVDIAIATSKGLQQFLCDCVAAVKWPRPHASISPSNVSKTPRVVYVMTANAATTSKAFTAFATSAADMLVLSVPIRAPSEADLAEWVLRQLDPAPTTPTSSATIRDFVRECGGNAQRISQRLATERAALLERLRQQHETLLSLNSMSLNSISLNSMSSSNMSLNHNASTSSNRLNRTKLDAKGLCRVYAAEADALALLSHACIAERDGLVGAALSRQIACGLLAHTDHEFDFDADVI